MQSGLTKVGFAGMVALLLVPMLVAVGVRSAAYSYCSKTDRAVAEQTLALSQVAEMEGALQQAGGVLRSVAGAGAPDSTETETCGRWLQETAKQQRLTLRNLALKKDETANPLTPALTATFRVDAPLSQVLLLLHNLQIPPRMVVYDIIRMHPGDPAKIRPYVAEVTLHVYALTGLKPPVDP